VYDPSNLGSLGLEGACSRSRTQKGDEIIKKEHVAKTGERGHSGYYIETYAIVLPDAKNETIGTPNRPEEPPTHARLICRQACASVTDQSQLPSVPADVGGQWSVSPSPHVFRFRLPPQMYAQQSDVRLYPGRINMVGLLLVCVREYGCRKAMKNLAKLLVTASGATLQLIRVQLSDGTSCLFKGIFEKAEVKGVYSCYGGAAVIEQGSWRATRDF